MQRNPKMEKKKKIIKEFFHVRDAGHQLQVGQHFLIVRIQMGYNHFLIIY